MFLILLCPVSQSASKNKILPIGECEALVDIDKQADQPSNLLIGNLVRPRSNYSDLVYFVFIAFYGNQQRRWTFNQRPCHLLTIIIRYACDSRVKNKFYVLYCPHPTPVSSAVGINMHLVQI